MAIQMILNKSAQCSFYFICLYKFFVSLKRELFHSVPMYVSILFSVKKNKRREKLFLFYSSDIDLCQHTEKE